MRAAPGKCHLAALPGLATWSSSCLRSTLRARTPHHAQISTLRVEVGVVTLEVELGTAAGEGQEAISKSRGEETEEGKHRRKLKHCFLF